MALDEAANQLNKKAKALALAFLLFAKIGNSDIINLSEVGDI